MLFCSFFFFTRSTLQRCVNASRVPLRRAEAPEALHPENAGMGSTASAGDEMSMESMESLEARRTKEMKQLMSMVTALLLPAVMAGHCGGGFGTNDGGNGSSVINGSAGNQAAPRRLWAPKKIEEALLKPNDGWPKWPYGGPLENSSGNDNSGGGGSDCDGGDGGGGIRGEIGAGCGVPLQQQ